MFIVDSENAQSEIFTRTLTINPLNDSPIITSYSIDSYDEDCGGQECNDDNIIVLDKFNW